MRQIETVLEELEKTNNEVENYELIYNLLSDDKIDEAKDNLKTLLRITCNRKDSNAVIYKILKMVKDIYISLIENLMMLCNIIIHISSY